MKQSAIHVKGNKPRITKRFRAAVQHVANPLHVYCRMVELGVSREASRYACALYEKAVYHPILG